MSKKESSRLRVWLLALPFLLIETARADITVPAVRAPRTPIIDGCFRPEEWSGAPVIRAGEFSLRIEYDDEFVFLLATQNPKYKTHNSEGPGERELRPSPAPEISIPQLPGPIQNQPPLVIVCNDTRVTSEDPGTLFRRDKAGTLALRIPWTALKADPRQRSTLHITVETKAGGPVRFEWGGFGVPPRQGTIQVQPYTLASANTANEGLLTGGLDLMTRERGINFIGSLNPDFRTVERGILNLDFSYFPRYAPETRPFFLSGASYYNAAFFAPQVVGNIDAGAKMYGDLDSRTKVGMMDTGDFWDQNAFVASVASQFDKNGIVSMGAKEFRETGSINEFLSGGLADRFGPVTVKADIQGTSDTGFGNGDSADAQIAYDHNGVFGRVTGVSTTANFYDRLGYFTEDDIKGINATAGALRSYKSGPLASSSFTLFTNQFHFQDNSPYRNYNGGGGDLSFKCGLDLQANYTAGRFLDNSDRFAEFSISQTAFSGKVRAGVDYTTGQLASAPYNDAIFFLSYLATPRFSMAGYLQMVRQFAFNDQTVLSASYELAKDQVLSGRLVQFDNQWNVYLRYAKSSTRGPEYEILLGDPNAPKFQKAVFVKFIFPMTVSY